MKDRHSKRDPRTGRFVKRSAWADPARVREVAEFAFFAVVVPFNVVAWVAVAVLIAQ